MKVPRLILFLSLLAMAAGCARTYEVVQLPLREAELYPLSQTGGSVTVAVDEIRDVNRAKRYFGVDLINMGILPVNIIVSNHGNTRVIVKPSGILLRKDIDVIDPIPVETVIKAAKEAASMKDETEKHVEKFFADVTFSETVLSPHDSYQGVLFFKSEKKPKNPDPFFRTISLFGESRMKMHVLVRDLDTQERFHYGPYSLSRHGGYFDNIYF